MSTTSGPQRHLRDGIHYPRRLGSRHESQHRSQTSSGLCVQEWGGRLIAAATPRAAFTFDASYITRDYKDRPAQVDINQIYTGNVWAGLVDPTQNNVYLITNNKWNWFVYQGIEFTATKQSTKLQFISTYTLAYDHIAGTWQPGDPAAFIQPETFANNAGIGTVRGNTTSSYTGDRPATAAGSIINGVPA